MAQSKDRREQLHKGRGEPEALDRTPVEIPIGCRKESKPLAQQIQEQIAIQIAKKQQGDNQQSPDEIYAELIDLDDEDNPEEHFITQYQFVAMHDPLIPGIDTPLNGSETNDFQSEDVPQAPESVPPQEEVKTPLP